MNSKERYNLNRIKKQLSSLIQIAAIKEVIKELDELLTDYQGWSNYETYLMALNIDNDKYKFEFVLYAAQLIKKESTVSYRSTATVWTSVQHRRFELADHIKKFTDLNYDEENLLTILAESAYSQINFEELADYYNQKIDEQQAAQLNPINPFTRLKHI